MKKTLTVLAMIALISGGALYAKPQMGPGKKGPGQMGPQKEGQMMHKRQHMLIKMAGLETVAQKYQIKIERLKLDHKEATMELREKKRDLHKDIADLTDKYSTDPDKIGSKIADKMKRLSNIEKKLSASREDMKDKIQAIKAQERKEIQAGVDKWVESLANNPDEMKKFVEHTQRMKQHHMNMNDCPHNKTGQNKKGKK